MQIKEALATGTILNSGTRKYEIKKVLGQGGFGITYLAASIVDVDNIPIEAQFAIKEHYISSMNERQGTSVAISNENNTAEIKESIDSFIVEAQRLNKLSLNHPGIVRVNESFRANGTAYYVMEYIKGQSLREFVKHSSGGRLSEEEALKLFRPIAETIGYLHENKVTHLDIKPDNILIRENGQPVIIDFGLSKHYSSKGTPTSTIKAAGCSAGYSPMEQYVGITTFTPEADIYALAATLLYMLTGKDPIISTEITPDSIRNSLPVEVSEQTKEAIVKGMAKLKEDRMNCIQGFFTDSNRPLSAGYILHLGNKNYQIVGVSETGGYFIRYIAVKLTDSGNAYDSNLTIKKTYSVYEYFAKGVHLRQKDSTVAEISSVSPSKEKFLALASKHKIPQTNAYVVNGTLYLVQDGKPPVPPIQPYYKYLRVGGAIILIVLASVLLNKISQSSENEEVQNVVEPKISVDKSRKESNIVNHAPTPISKPTVEQKSTICKLSYEEKFRIAEAEGNIRQITALAEKEYTPACDYLAQYYIEQEDNSKNCEAAKKWASKASPSVKERVLNELRLRAY